MYTVQWELLREKTFMNFAVLWLFGKVFSAKFGSVVSFGTAKASNPRKFSLQKSGFLSRKFSTIHDMSYVVIDDVK